MICIKTDMERMPESCGRCEGLKVRVHGSAKCRFTGKNLAYWGYEKRDRNCPLVEAEDGK